MEGNRGSSILRALRVTGTIALKSGWKTSVEIFTNDKKIWLAKSGSGFSCHLISKFAGRMAKQTTNALAQQRFNFVNNDMNSTANSTTYADTNLLVLPSAGAVGHPLGKAKEFVVRSFTGISCVFACACLVMTLVI